MKTGFIGAGKVGCSLGKYLSNHGVKVAGYYDRDTEAASDAAQFTNTARYDTAEELAADCDVLFITVPDGLIRTTFLALAGIDPAQAATDPTQAATEPALAGKFICHCSGSLSSREVFAGIEETGAFGFSVHPLFAVSDRHKTWQELDKAFFTLEGDPARLDDMSDFLTKAGVRFQIIDPAAKTRYHLAAVYGSNLICALIGESVQLLQECGFSEGDALKAIGPLVRGNVEHALEAGPVQALTGPVERGDVTTLQKHLGVMTAEEDQQLYRLLSKKLLGLAREKHPDRDYSDLERFLQ